MSDRLSIDDELTLERLDTCQRTMRRTFPFTFLSIVMVCVVLGGRVPLGAILMWAVAMLLALAACFWFSVCYARDRRAGAVLSWRRGVLGSALVGIGWGSLGVLAMPYLGDTALAAYVLVFALGVSSVSVLSTAASRSRFAALNGTMAGLLTLSYLASGYVEARKLACAIPLYVMVMSALHTQVHGIVVNNIRLTLELREAAMHDALTGLLNRRAFSDVVRDAMVDALRWGERIAVLYLDVDRFKTVNDTLGHAAGDRVLVETAARLVTELRPGDACGRIGGDEYAVLLRRVTNELDVAYVSSRIVATMNRPFIVGDGLARVGVSVGSTIMRADSDAGALLREADEAQYRAKRAGGGRAVAFDAEDIADMRRTVQSGAEIAPAPGPGAGLGLMR